ncbi:hypothetical protein [Jannaschia sp. R86511]|uniref:hypothetical protein n=1 Tax=Jannaschia sp. R86511 TaxID=3093853 RepID=UPI0036D2A779
MGCAEAERVERLVRQEPGVPGLRLLLDDDALAAWLTERLGPAAGAARRTYLRWKPGAGGVARVRLAGPVTSDEGRTGGDDLFLAVWHRDSAAKLDKTLLRGGGSLVVVDHDALAVLGRPAADRDLPALARLQTHGSRWLRRLDAADDRARQRLNRVAGGHDPAVTLAWKPQRRWVGLAGDRDGAGVVLRACRPAALPGVVLRYRAAAHALAGAGASGHPVPQLLGVNRRRGLVAVEHLPGIALDDVTGAGTASAHHAAGGLLARLHGAGAAGGATAGVPGLGPDAELRALVAAARTVDLLLPDAGAGEVATELGRALLGLPRREPVLLHGDLSPDQLVVAPDGDAGLIDLDEVALGPASYDLAGMAASLRLAHPLTADDRLADLLAGYAAHHAPPGADELRVRTAAHLLRRAPEPFRSGRDGWAGQVGQAVRAAAQVLRSGSAREGVLR